MEKFYHQEKNIKNANLIHLKYVDDLSLAEAINLPDKLVHATGRVQPDTFHARTGHALPIEKSKVYNQLLRTDEYARENGMKINQKKTKIIVFNPCKSKDFMPEFPLNGQILEVVEEMKLLGIIISSDLSWHANTEYIVTKANKRLWMLRRLQNLGAEKEDLLEIYRTQVRCVLEMAVPAWHSSISQLEKRNNERVQKSAFHIILGHDYISYRNALKVLNLESLDSRRNQLCLKFAKKCEKNEKFKYWFKLNENYKNTRTEKSRYCEVKSRLSRLQRSPISFLTNILNDYYRRKK